MLVIYILTFFGKSLRFFTFLDTDFILQSEIKRGTMLVCIDKVQCSVLLSSRRTPSCRSVSLLFRILCVVVKEQVRIAPESTFQNSICQIDFGARGF